jgi:hypothetical protein
MKETTMPKSFTAGYRTILIQKALKAIRSGGVHALLQSGFPPSIMDEALRLDEVSVYDAAAEEERFARISRRSMKETTMRFPSIKDVATELRAINKEADAGRDEVDVRLQVYEDGAWAVRWGLSDYQDHRGYWGASSVPGSNRRFHSEDVARNLIDQAKDAYADSKYSRPHGVMR